MTLHYLYLGLAILLELVGSSLLKACDGFTRLLPTIACVVAYTVCFYFLSLALRAIPLGIAYAVWSGIGIVCTALISLFVFKQPINFPSMIGIALVIAGVVIMHVFSNSAAS